MIVQQPEVVTIPQGTNGCLMLRTIGHPAAYRWFHDGLPIPGATNARYWIKSASLHDNGLYAMVMSNAIGQATSGPIALVVSNVRVERIAEIHWQVAASSTFMLQFSERLGPAAHWEAFGSPMIESDTVVVPASLLAKPSRFFRLRGWVDSRIQSFEPHCRLWVVGPIGSQRSIEYVARDTGWTNWQALTNLTLTGGSQWFVDRESGWEGGRVYRTMPSP